MRLDSAEPSTVAQVCMVCDAAGPTEKHHFAPRILFGDEADLWPIWDLCRPCREEWHTSYGVPIEDGEQP